MNRSKEPSFADRQNAAATAKKAALEKHRAMLSDPGLGERQAARQAVAFARENRAAERRTAQVARATREAAEQAVKEAAEQAARETVLRAEGAREAAAKARAARDPTLETRNRAALDARRAARKAKKRKGR